MNEVSGEGSERVKEVINYKFLHPGATFMPLGFPSFHSLVPFTHFQPSAHSGHPSVRPLGGVARALSLGVNLLGHNGNSQDGRMKVLR